MVKPARDDQTSSGRSNQLGMVKPARNGQMSSGWSNQLGMVKPAQDDQTSLGWSNQLGTIKPAWDGQTSSGRKENSLGLEKENSLGLERKAISLTLPLPPALSPAEIVLPVKIWHHTFTAHMANQIKRRNVSSLTYENFPEEISLTLPLPTALSPAEIVLPVKIWHHTFTAHMANQIKRRNVSSLTYENFPEGHPSQYCSHPCTLNSTLSPVLNPTIAQLSLNRQQPLTFSHN
ncbi:hypothetical protein F511_13401 [Dorcoceras hygrometricum]|uniref:Uncharacterized protein n=1 Tax=Dorcoceras hygrometricum TaxID=472368 RepID=A0A2Z7BTI1_9LAMI|nr:hypothetical protein F511_13401 [Dorcoceras hygrometricum]